MISIGLVVVNTAVIEALAGCKPGVGIGTVVYVETRALAPVGIGLEVTVSGAAALMTSDSIDPRADAVVDM